MIYLRYLLLLACFILPFSVVKAQDRLRLKFTFIRKINDVDKYYSLFILKDEDIVSYDQLNFTHYYRDILLPKRVSPDSVMEYLCQNDSVIHIDSDEGDGLLLRLGMTDSKFKLALDLSKKELVPSIRSGKTSAMFGWSGLNNGSKLALKILLSTMINAPKIPRRFHGYLIFRVDGLLDRNNDIICAICSTDCVKPFYVAIPSFYLRHRR